MTVEAATYISGLNIALPPSNDPKSEGDDHLRLIKSVLKATFPNANAPITITAAQLNDAFLKYSGGPQIVYAATTFNAVVTMGANGTLSMPLYFNANGYNPSIRANSGLPGFEWINTANSAIIMSLNDAGVLNVTNTLYARAEIQWWAGNTYYCRARADVAGLWGLINQAGNQWNFQVWDSGNYQFRGLSTLAINVSSGDTNGYMGTLGPGYLKLNEYSNGGYIDLMQARDQDYRWRIMYNIGQDTLSFYYKPGGYVTIQTNSDIYCSGFGSIWSAINGLGGKANAGAKVQWDSGVAEWGPLNGPVTYDVPAPYVMCGWHTQSNGNWVSGAQWIRGVQLRNQ